MKAVECPHCGKVMFLEEKSSNDRFSDSIPSGKSYAFGIRREERSCPHCKKPVKTFSFCTPL